jgi:hypothetical protein
LPRSAQDELLALRECEENPSLEDALDRLRRGLSSKRNRTVERAAKLAAAQQRRELLDDLAGAYQGFLGEPRKTDPGCLAKTAIVEALWQLEYPEADFFLQGIRYHQYEPGFGGETDSAAQLRACCGFALIQQSHPRALGELVDLLADSEKTARAGAARAIAHGGGRESALLLRLKVALGDPSPEVLGECFSGLLQLEGEEAIPRVAKYLYDPAEDLRCEAAIALGETHSQIAFQHLEKQIHKADSREYERVLYAAIGLLSLPEAVDYLLSLVTSDDVRQSILAIKGLTHCRDRQAIEERLAQIVDQIGNRDLLQAFQEAFPR